MLLFTVVSGLIPGVGSALKGKIMKRLLISACLLSSGVCAVQAQENVLSGLPQSTNVAAAFSTTSGARAPLVKPLSQSASLLVSDALTSVLTASVPTAVETALALPFAATDAAMPEPSPEPLPRFIYSDRDDYRWQLGLGVSFERFRSSAYSASGVGTNTSLSFFLNDWLGAEGNISTFFAPTIFDGDHVKLVNYGVGPKIAWRRPRWEPWFHGLFGGTHAVPRIAGHSQNGFSLQFGGGADYRVLPRLSFRLELDYVRTRLFGQWQNNGQAAAGIVFHF
jgi:opacity protein-like surface antigen